MVCDFLVDILWPVGRYKVRCASANRIPAHGTQMLVAVAAAVHTHRQVRAKIGTLLSIALPLLTSRQESPRFIGFIPKSVRANGIVREGDDFRFVFVDLIGDNYI